MKTKLTLTKRIAEIYARGDNVIKYLKSLDARNSNTIEDIMISYDFQAGSYIRAYESSPAYLDSYTNEIALLLQSLGEFGTLLEAGCGEATTLAILGRKLPPRVCLGGFDIAWSRIKLGMEFTRRMGVNSTLFCSDLFEIPLANNSVDIVYTSHSIEPNGGHEVEAIKELARVAKRWLVLLEPAYDLAMPEARARMEEHGYVRNLADVIRGLGLELVRHELFPVCGNPLNPTGLYLVRAGGGGGWQGCFIRFPLSVIRMSSESRRRCLSCSRIHAGLSCNWRCAVSDGKSRCARNQVRASETLKVFTHS